MLWMKYDRARMKRALLLVAFAGVTLAQNRAPAFVSPEVRGDRVTFRVYAPKAEAVRVIGSDIPGLMQGQMKKAENGLWELDFGPVPQGAYRYSFSIDGATVL